MKILVDNVRAFLVDFSPSDLEKVRKKLETYAPGYRYTYLFKQRKWNGKVSMLNGEAIPTGLLPVVVKGFPNIQIIDNRGVSVPTFRETSVPLRDYQRDVLKAAFENKLYGTWWPRGVIKVATGGGKTEIAAAMIEMTNLKTLFLVHRKELVDQAVDRFAKYGVAAGKITEGKLDTESRLVVATIQSLMSFRHKVNKTKNRSAEDVASIKAKKIARGQTITDFLNKVEQVFIDEAHLTAATLDKGNMFAEALNLMPNAYMRWGLTATPFMREEYHDWLLEGTTGQILYEIKSRELIDDGWLAEPKITMYRMKMQSLGDWQDDYHFGVIDHEKRNEKIIECIKTRPGPIMILVQRINHGKILLELCNKAGLRVRFLHGDVSLPDRKQALTDLKSGQIHAVIGSTIWDEGLDVEEIRTLILAGGGKSKIKNLQRLGRGIRLSRGKEEVEVIDFFDEGSRWLRAHARQRKKIWLDEGFEVEVI